MRIVANPAVSALADRYGRLEHVLAVCALVVALATAMLMVVDGFVAILAVILVLAFAQGPLIALTDALTLTRLARAAGRFDRYGGIRVWGSIAFAAANLGTGTLLVWLPPASIVLCLTAAAVCVAAAAVAVAAARDGSRPGPPVPRARRAGVAGLLRPRILAVIVGAALIQASHAVVYAFSTLHWQATGLSSAGIGALWALGVLAEIGFFVLLGASRLARIAPVTLLLAGGAAAVVRWLGMAADPAWPLLVPLQMAHALTFGATHAGSVFLLAQMAPPEGRAQVQAWLAAVWAGLMASFISLAGYLTPTWGEATYLPMALAAAGGVLVVALALRGGGREHAAPAGDGGTSDHPTGA